VVQNPLVSTFLFFLIQALWCRIQTSLIKQM
jgi:hypothetical protein